MNDNTHGPGVDALIARKFAACVSGGLFAGADAVPTTTTGCPGGFPHRGDPGQPVGVVGVDHAPQSGDGRDDDRIERLRARTRKIARSAMCSGLSTAHISPQTSITVHEGGTLVKLARSGQGQKGGGKRGRVGGFSASSRKRLVRFMASLNPVAMGAESTDFVTLTYPRTFPADGRAWKRDLDAFCKVLGRHPDVTAWVWKLEPQKRWAPHFHLVVFGRAALDPEWVADAWWRIVGEGGADHRAAGTQTQPVRSWSGVLHYSAKYIAKIDHADDLPEFWRNVGRWWGKGGDFVIDDETIALTDAQFFAIRRVLRRWQERQTGRRCRTWGRSGISSFMAHPEALRLATWAERHFS